MVPEFDKEGNLPVGIHKIKWPEFREKFGYNHYRKELIRGMLDALKSLKKAGCSTVFIDGSFVTDKRKPNDYDGCWATTGVDINSLDPAFKDFRSRRIAQKVKFSGELFPATGINKYGQTMLDFFQEDRNANPKGIIEINLGDINDQE